MRRIKLIDPKNKQTAILEAGIRVFAQKGFSAATIKDVAKAAKVAAGTVYLYYKNKDDLLIQCMHELMDKTMHEIKLEAAQETDPIERLYKFILKHIEHFSQNPVLARFLIVEIRQSEEFYTRYPTFNPLNEYLSHVRSLIDEAANAGVLKEIDHQALSYMIIGTMDQVLTQWLIGGAKLDLIKISGDIRKILRSGITLTEKAT